MRLENALWGSLAVAIAYIDAVTKNRIEIKNLKKWLYK